MTQQHRIDQRIRDLLNGGIDGELSGDERLELATLLADSDEVCNLNEELKVVTGQLDDLPELEPPQYLQASIERQIRLPEQGSDHPQRKVFFGTWLPAHWLRTSFALAAGAVLTIGIYEMGSSPITAEDAANLSGTMVKSQLSGEGELLDSFHISTGTLNGLVELRSIEDLYTLDVQLKAQVPTQVVVDFAGRGLDFEGVTRKQDRKDSVSISEGSISIASSGEQQFRLNLRRSEEVDPHVSAPLALAFFANKILVHEAEMHILK